MKKIILLSFLILIPASLSAVLMESYDEPVKGLSDNTVIDIVTYKGAVWLATNGGISFCNLGDSIWYSYTRANGLVSNEISAIYSGGDTLWAATNHTVEVDGTEVTYADGLSFTNDNGLNWDTLMVEGSYGYQSTIFDITGYDSLIFCASWVGGLFGSFNGGVDWNHIFYSPYDSALADSGKGYLSSRNIYFSALIDTFHTDSLVLWAGTADGLLRYVYAPLYAKMTSSHITGIFPGDSCVYFGGDMGFTRLSYIGGVENYHTAFVADGLPGKAISSAYWFADRLFVGTLDSLYGSGTGLAISDDEGVTFHTDYVGLDDLIGADKFPIDFASVSKYLFLAGFKAGLYMSSDTGRNWQKVYIDSLDTTLSNGRNIINTVVADSFNLWVGTDSGLVHLYLDTSGTIDSLKNYVFGDNDSSGARSYRARVQKYIDTTGVLDSTAVWTINHPLDTSVGVYAIQRYSNEAGLWDPPFYSTNPYYDIAFIDSAAYLVGQDLFGSSPNDTVFYIDAASAIYDLNSPYISFSGEKLNSIAIINDTIYVGAERGYAMSPASSTYWLLKITNSNLRRHDRVSRYVIDNGISGNFVTAFGLQTLPTGENLIWATTRPGASGGGYEGISASTLDGSSWAVKDSGTVCWNYAFADSTVFAATSAGLLRSVDLGTSWDTLVISGILINFQPPLSYTISPETPVYAVCIVDDTMLWVGTSDGAARIALSDLGSSPWDIFRAYDTSRTVFAYPVPYSPYSTSDKITFHYPVPKDASVTIEVYDFAMNLVKRVINNEWRLGGRDAVYSSDRWDGHNGKGEIVAAGIYYFKVALSTGENYWGKLAIKP